MSPAFEQLYAAFAPYKDDMHLAQRVGINRPLHLLTEEDLFVIRSKYDFGVLLYGERFKHFLPRLLELYGFDSFSVDLALGIFIEYRLKDKEWTCWPANEVAAIRSLMRENWRLSPKCVEDLEIIVSLETELVWYLGNWLQENPGELAKFLWQTNWAKPPHDLLEWAKRPHVRRELERLFFLQTDPKTAELFSNVVALLENLALTP